MEVWSSIIGFEGLYEVSTHGRVRSLDRSITYSDGRVRQYAGKILKKINDGKYYSAFLGKGQKRRVHVLVAAAFIGNRKKGYDVCHNDGDKTNNHVDNLRYGTRTENMRDVRVHGYALSKPVIRSDGKRYPSMCAASENGFNRQLISRVCAGKQTSHKGYGWKYDGYT